MNQYPEFSRLANHYLQLQDRSAAWLARQLRRHPSTVTRWLNDATRPGDLETVQQIAKILGLTPAEEQVLLEAADYGYLIPGRDTDVSSPQPVNSYTSAIADFVAYDDQWVGREALIQQLCSQLQASSRLLLLVGMTGIGKTALAERLSLALTGWPADARYPVYRINFDYRERDADFISVTAKWLEDWQETLALEAHRSPQALLQKIVDLLSENRCLVIIDALERILTGSTEEQRGDWNDLWWGEFFQRLLSAERLHSRLILTSQELPVQLIRLGAQYPNRWQRYLLDGLAAEEQVVLFQKTGLEIDSDSPSWHYLLRIGAVYAGHPLSLRAIAGEIVNDYFANVLAYWREFGREIERVEEDIAAARHAGLVQAPGDQWQIDRYSIALQRQVRHRFDQTLQRLRQRAPAAYLLLCAAAEYRFPVKQEWWLRHLEYRGYTPEQQRTALQSLRDRYLLDESLDGEGNRLLGLHALIRSVALDHRRVLYLDNRSLPRV